MILSQGRIVSRTMPDGTVTERRGNAYTHVDTATLNAELESTRHWIKGCDCEACELNRGANEDT